LALPDVLGFADWGLAVVDGASIATSRVGVVVSNQAVMLENPPGHHFPTSNYAARLGEEGLRDSFVQLELRCRSKMGRV